jgi:hypothetical protein
MTGFAGAVSARTVAGFLPLALVLTGCGVGERAPKDPVEAQIARLTEQGFTIVSDGRSTGAPTALRYQGTPEAVITCQREGGRSAATDQSGTAASSDGRYTVTQAGEVAAYVIVAPSGDLRGLYINDVVRTVATSGGNVVARQLEKIEFPPGNSGRFRNGVSCQAKT